MVSSCMIFQHAMLTLLTGRKALAPPLNRSFLRALATQSTTTPDLSSIEQSLNTSVQEAQSIASSLLSSQSSSAFHPVSIASTAPSDVNSIASQFTFTQHNKLTTGQLGSTLSTKDQHKPHELVLNPPKPQDVTLELLMASQAHMGHATALWNPANQRYIYGIRQGIHIISLEATAAHLRRAAKVVEGVAYHGGIILFVGTREGQSPAVVRAAQLAKGCHLFERWTPGSITNGEQILKKCGLKVLDPLDKEMVGYEDKINAWKALKPDLVVVMNPLENYVLLQECGLYNIPTIGVVDTDVDPAWVTYPIPANDDRLVSLHLLSVT